MAPQSDSPIPKTIKLLKATQELALTYTNADAYKLSAELLRVLSPSAEVRGHGTPTLQIGKKNVAITAITPVGNYAIKIVFDDGHDSGLYSWNYLYELCVNQTTYWNNYLESLHTANKSRDPETSIVKLIDPTQH